MSDEHPDALTAQLVALRNEALRLPGVGAVAIVMVHGGRMPDGELVFDSGATMATRGCDCGSPDCSEPRALMQQELGTAMSLARMKLEEPPLETKETTDEKA